MSSASDAERHRHVMYAYTLNCLSTAQEICWTLQYTQVQWRGQKINDTEEPIEKNITSS